MIMTNKQKNAYRRLRYKAIKTISEKNHYDYSGETLRVLRDMKIADLVLKGWIRVTDVDTYVKELITKW